MRLRKFTDRVICDKRIKMPPTDPFITSQLWVPFHSQWAASSLHVANERNSLTYEDLAIITAYVCLPYTVQLKRVLYYHLAFNK